MRAWHRWLWLFIWMMVGVGGWWPHATLAASPSCTINGASGGSAYADCLPATLGWGSAISSQNKVYDTPDSAGADYFAYMTTQTPSLCEYGCDLSVVPNTGWTERVSKIVQLRRYNQQGVVINTYVPQTNAAAQCPPNYQVVTDYDPTGFYKVFACRPAAAVKDAMEQATSTDDSNTCGCEWGQNPVSLSDLRKMDQVEDYRNQSPYPIVWSRTFNGRANQWFFRYDRRLFAQVAATNPNRATATLRRQDGQILMFQGVLAGGQWTWTPAMATATRSAMVLMTLTSVPDLSAFTLVNHQDETETYNGAGQLVKMQDARSLPLVFTYDPRGRLVRIDDASGRSLGLTYPDDETGQTVDIVNPQGQHTPQTYHVYTNAADYASAQVPDTISDGTRAVGYVVGPNPLGGSSASAVLLNVVQGDNTSVTLNYDAQNNYTGLTDANGDRYSTYSYSSGLVTQTVHGANQETLKYSSTKVTFPNGQFVTYGKDAVTDKMASQTQACPWCTGTQSKAIVYDSAGNPASLTDFNGHVETRTNDLIRGVPLSITQASGTAQARTITTTWDARFLKPDTVTQPVMTPQGAGSQVVTSTYDNTGNLTAWSVAVTGPNGYSLTRSGAATYNGFGEPLTITDARGHTTSATYDSQGNRLTATDALGHVTTYGGYDTAGNVGWVQDANGLQTQFTYDALQRITQIQRGCGSGAGCHWETTAITYNPAGMLSKIVGPDGRGIAYHYDTAHRLTQTDWLDTDGSSVLGSETLTLSVSSEVTQRVKTDASVHVIQTQGFGYDALSRVTAQIDSHSNPFTQTWDAQSNRVTTQDPLAHGQTMTYDALNRLTQTTLADSLVESLAYGPDDTVVSQTDAKGVTTTQSPNGFGEVVERNSPDSGDTYFTRDANGNVLTRTDARGVTLTTTYDALDRPLTQVGSTGGVDEQITWSYDTCTNGVGHLCSVTDRTGTTAFTYDTWGRVTRKTVQVFGQTLTLSYTYNTTGQLTTITYPSGQVLTQTWGHGQVVSQQWGASAGSGLSIFSGAQYDAWGKTQGWTWGSGRGFSLAYDQDGRVSAIGAGAGAASQAYTYDAAWRLTGITRQPANATTTFGYDVRDRLTSGTTWGSYTYDGNSNRLTWLGALGPQAYTYGASNNKLTAWNGTATTTDTAGNLLNPSGLTLTFDDWSRLRTATPMGGPLVTYGVNGLNERVSSQQGTVKRIYIYASVGHLLGVYDGATGQPVEELAYLGERPVATVRAGTVYPIETDHLMAPLRVLDTGNTVLWSWEDREPFGASAPTSPSGFVFDLRFPGQWADEVTGLVSNGFRDYDPVDGRYIEPDPVGLKAGMNPYGYDFVSPLAGYDSDGKDVRRLSVVGNNVGIIVAIKYQGEYADPRIEQQINRAIEDTWSGTFGKYHVTISVVDGDDNIIILSHGPGISNVALSNNRGEWFAYMDCKNTSRLKDFAHEAGHLMGLPDEYTEAGVVDGVRYTTPNPGYENDIMGNRSANPSETDIANIIANYRIGHPQ